MKLHITDCVRRLLQKLEEGPYYPAKVMFNLHGLFKLMECELDDLLMDKFPDWAVDNYFFDSYDESLELKYVPNSWAPTQDQLDSLRDFGFYLLYINYEDGVTARLYNLSSGQGGWSRCNNNAGKRNDISRS